VVNHYKDIQVVEVFSVSVAARGGGAIAPGRRHKGGAKMMPRKAKKAIEILFFL